jgi:hypothetical protein
LQCSWYSRGTAGGTAIDAFPLPWIVAHQDKIANVAAEVPHAMNILQQGSEADAASHPACGADQS